MQLLNDNRLMERTVTRRATEAHCRRDPRRRSRSRSSSRAERLDDRARNLAAGVLLLTGDEISVPKVIIDPSLTARRDDDRYAALSRCSKCILIRMTTIALSATGHPSHGHHLENRRSAANVIA